jgi:hypothetical protein
VPDGRRAARELISKVLETGRETEGIPVFLQKNAHCRKRFRAFNGCDLPGCGGHESSPIQSYRRLLRAVKKACATAKPKGAERGSFPFLVE